MIQWIGWPATPLLEKQTKNNETKLPVSITVKVKGNAQDRYPIVILLVFLV